MSNAVLEHVQEPQKVLKEAFRVLEPGGMILSIIPFMQPFHASPDDYQRFTLPGIQYLHKDFELLESGVYSGPISGLLWVFQETIASILSLGIPQLRNILYIAILLLTWPIKFLDVIFMHFSSAKNCASSFYVIAKKPLSEGSIS